MKSLIPVLIFFLTSCVLLASPSEPTWWEDPATRIVDEASDSSHYSPANLGQLKHVAKQARAHLEATLPGGAGTEVNALVDSFEPQDGGQYTPQELSDLKALNYAPLNLGQLKAVAKPFYDRLIQSGYDTKANLIQRGYPSGWAHDYPWDPSTPVAENYSPANLGQLKMVFSFDLSGQAPPVLPDSWKLQYFSTLDVDPEADADGNGFSNLDEYLAGSDPTNYYSQPDGLGGHLLIQPSILSITGDHQLAFVATELASPVEVIVVDASTSIPLINAPIVFQTNSLSGGFAVEQGGPFSLTLETRTTITGGILFHWAMPSEPGRVSTQIIASETTIEEASATALLLPASQVAAGHHFSFYAESAGPVHGWGNNERGQLSITPSQGVLIPTLLNNFSGNVILIRAGAAHSLALTEQGSVLAWGANEHGQLGDGARITRSDPVAVPNLAGIVDVQAGKSHSVALKNDGSVYCWGANHYGQLGMASPPYQAMPQKVEGLPAIIQVAIGNHHTLALAVDGSIWIWGSNEFGQAGNMTASMFTEPHQIVHAGEFVTVVSGGRHIVALTNSGDLWSWGANEFGQLGDNSTTGNATPGQLSTLGTGLLVSAGEIHTLAKDSSNQLHVWGGNTHGQLGLGDTSDRLEPVALTGTPAINSLAAGKWHSLVITSDENLLIWGDNHNQNLGIDSQASYVSTPQAVLIPGEN